MSSKLRFDHLHHFWSNMYVVFIDVTVLINDSRLIRAFSIRTKPTNLSEISQCQTVMRQLGRSSTAHLLR